MEEDVHIDNTAEDTDNTTENIDNTEEQLIKKRFKKLSIIPSTCEHEDAGKVNTADSKNKTAASPAIIKPASLINYKVLYESCESESKEQSMGLQKVIDNLEIDKQDLIVKVGGLVRSTELCKEEYEKLKEEYKSLQEKSQLKLPEDTMEKYYKRIEGYTDACISSVTENINKNVYNPNCLEDDCISDEDEHKLECIQCHKLYHYSCTQLPLYQLSYFLIKGYRKYICPRCTVVPDYLKEVMASKGNIRTPLKLLPIKTVEEAVPITASIGSQTGRGWKAFELMENDCKKAEEDLKVKTAEMQRVLDEKQKIKNNNTLLKQAATTEKKNQEVLRKTIESQDEMLSKYSSKDNSSSNSNEGAITELTTKLNQAMEDNKLHNANITDLLEQRNELANTVQQHTEASKKDKQELTRLQCEVNEYEKSMTAYEESERKPKNISIKHKDFHDQQEKSGNPAYIDSMAMLEESMKCKIEQIGKTLEETILKQVNDNNQLIEEKLKEVMVYTKSYAESAKNNLIPNGTPVEPAGNVNLRTIMHEARNEELAEERDKKLRSANIILHGVNEINNTNKDEAKMADGKYMMEFFDAVGVNVTYKSLIRLGKPDPNKNRPIKLTMSSEEEKSKVMENLRNLKGSDTFQRVSVTHDYTTAERQLIKEYADKAKEKNDNELENSKYSWKVRGNPKNGLFLKKVLNRPPQVQHVVLIN